MDQVIPKVPVRQWVLSLPIPLRFVLAAWPSLITVVLQVVQRVITRFLVRQSQAKADLAKTGSVTLIQRFGSAANLNIQLYCLVLDMLMIAFPKLIVVPNNLPVRSSEK